MMPKPDRDLPQNSYSTALRAALDRARREHADLDSRRQARRGDDDANGSGGRVPPGRGGRRSGGGGSDDDSGDGDGEEVAYEEEPVPFADLPKAVREAVVEQCPGAGHFDAARLTDGEVVCYNVLARRGRVEMSVTLSVLGEVMDFEVDIAPSRLPKPVRETLEREFDGVEFERASSVTMHFFELTYVEDGVARVLQVDASGKVLSDVEEAELESEPFDGFDPGDEEGYDPKRDNEDEKPRYH